MWVEGKKKKKKEKTLIVIHLPTRSNFFYALFSLLIALTVRVADTVKILKSSGRHPIYVVRTVWYVETEHNGDRWQALKYPFSL